MIECEKFAAGSSYSCTVPRLQLELTRLAHPDALASQAHALCGLCIDFSEGSGKVSMCPRSQSFMSPEKLHHWPG